MNMLYCDSRFLRIEGTFRSECWDCFKVKVPRGITVRQDLHACHPMKSSLLVLDYLFMMLSLECIGNGKGAGGGGGVPN